jgi:peptidoglycan/xylan/chitin deacetylase (PgdA/CDA1 family)
VTIQTAAIDRDSGASLRKKVKAALGYVVYSLGLHRWLLRDRAVIVAFHRVSASAEGRALNCPPHVFASLCRFFKKHFTVMPLAELLRRLRHNEGLGGALVITFDDGYRDNRIVAAPILHELRLPATFFVATNFIDSDTVPFWDRNDGVKSEWMSWAEVESLKRMGFDIGGHTMNHANLAEVELAMAEHEIAGCRQMLTGKLGVAVPHFAYPFGGAGNITPAARNAVGRLGFECCLSCHGGTVRPEDDAFELRREPINAWVASPYQYGFELIMRAREERR